MIFPTVMNLLVAVVLESDVDAATRVLLAAGVMHFIHVKKLAGSLQDHLKEVERAVSPQKITELRRRIESLLGLADIFPSSDARIEIDPLELELLEPADVEATQAILNNLSGSIKRFRDEQQSISLEIQRLADIHRQVDLYGDIQKGLQANSEFSYLTMQTGAVPTTRVASLRRDLADVPSVMITVKEAETEHLLFLITMKSDSNRVDRALESCQWHDEQFRGEYKGIDGEVARNLDDRTTSLHERHDEIESLIREAVKKKQDALVRQWKNLRMNELYGTVQSYFSKTAKTVLFTGWAPAHDRTTIDDSIRKACKGTCYLEWHDPPGSPDADRSEIPVELNNPTLLSPFQLLVQNFSVPEYGSLDPTAFVAIAYLAMFGLMFGDAGQGLVLIILGILGRLLYKKRNTIRKLMALLIWCGSASVVTGVLFGSYFGAQLFRPLWFDYHAIVSGHGGGRYVSSVYDVLVITIYFGISIISLGLLINWLNLVMKRRWFHLIFDKGGIIGGLIYGAGVWATFYFVSHGYSELPREDLLLLLIGIPILLLAFKAPLEHKRRHGNGPFRFMSLVDYFMEWIVEVLEIFTGYLANTLSFMRVAGLGIAHESLMIAFFQMARMVGGERGFSIWSLPVLVIGNLLVIGLEGLSAGIQSLRLNYYEFFSKYFTGTGEAYDPVSLHTKG